MECNKDEAIRAKSIAEKKMQDKDFSTARKLVLKAQQLYENLENISQMLIVCHVHCSADQKLFGKEMDWYGILQIEQTADEPTIKKQYRKLALQLHPDKNKFPGAEAAFKLIGEAQTVLLDKGKRKLHDDLRKIAVHKPVVHYQPPPRATNTSNFVVQNHSRSNFTGFNSQGHQTQSRLTFWTACPFCYARYQYYIEFVNKQVICQRCGKHFIAYDIVMQGAPNSNQPPFHQRRDFPNQGAFKVESEVRTNFSAQHLKKEKLNHKRKKMQQEESGESCDSESSNDTEDDMHIDRDGDFKVKLNPGHTAKGPRRSDRCRQKVSYKENLSDDNGDDDENDDGDFVNSQKHDNGNASSYATKKVNGFGLRENASNKHKRCVADIKTHNEVKKGKNLHSNEREIKAAKNAASNGEAKNAASNEKVESDADCSSNSEVYHRSDPEFNDFDKDRNEKCFTEGQIWACYGNLDAMPRFYARIMKVCSPGFRLRILWLEAVLDGEQEKLRAEEDLPVSCGKFKKGNSEYTENLPMFSHFVYWEIGQARNTFKIFPRKGQTWALFKNGDIKKSDLDANAKIEYEFVEILSEFSEDVGLYIAYLVKLKGFVSVFCRTCKEGKGTFQIPPGELFRFSHMVPSCKLTGEERDDVPKGAFELDPAALPKNMEEIAARGDIRVEIDNKDVNGSCLKSSDDGKPKGVPGYQTSIHLGNVKEADLQTEPEEGVTCVEDSDASPDSSEGIVILEPEFFNFDAEKSLDKFQVGQIWSLYSDEDGLPKYYGKITKVHPKNFNLQLKWLESTFRRQNDEIPISCGKFKIKGRQCRYTSAGPFSHQLKAVSVTRKDEYTVLPRKGEIWALYKNWSAEIKQADLKNCEYDVVEIIEEDTSWTRVMFLERVSGFNAVFKARMKEGSSVQLVISHEDLLKFSHQIPCFRLTEERGGSLRGFWELDPAALPVRYFR